VEGTIKNEPRQGKQRRCKYGGGANMEEVQPPDLAIWGVEKVDFFIITKYKSKTMVL
jgi:hypothetical protein